MIIWILRGRMYILFGGWRGNRECEFFEFVLRIKILLVFDFNNLNFFIRELGYFVYIVELVKN